MTVRIGINGFGRIGRCILAHISESSRSDLKVVKINATGPLETSAHLMRYDSVHGRFPGKITTENGKLNLVSLHLKQVKDIYQKKQSKLCPLLNMQEQVQLKEKVQQQVNNL